MVDIYLKQKRSGDSNLFNISIKSGIHDIKIMT